MKISQSFKKLVSRFGFSIISRPKNFVLKKRKLVGRLPPVKSLLPPVKIETDPIVYRQSITTIFSNFYKIARKYLIVPATSVPSERVFSTSGNIITEKYQNALPLMRHQYPILCICICNFS